MQKKYINTTMDLSNIFKQNAKLYPNGIKLLCSGYYPIAYLDVDIDEKWVEDFELIQLTILRILDCGIYDVEQIAKLLGLNERYIAKLIRLLEGYGHIDDCSHLTSLGLESLSSEQKKLLKHTSEVFKCDAISGNLIKKECMIDEKYVYELKELPRNGIYLEKMEGVYRNELFQQISKIGLDHFLDINKSILHVNVERINSIKLKTVKYVRGYIVKHSSLSNPVFITRIRNGKSEDHSSKISWKVVLASDVDLKYLEERNLFGCNDKSIEELKYQVGYIEEASKKKTDEEILKAIEGRSFINIKKHHITNEKVIIDFDASDILSVKGNFIEMLEQLAFYGMYIEVYDDVLGKVVCFKTEDSNLLKLAKLYKQVLTKREKYNIRKNFNEQNIALERIIPDTEKILRKLL